MALQNQSAAIEAANALSFEPYVHLTEGNTIKLNDNTVLKTHGQFLTDVGVTQLSPFTKKYVASEAGRSRLPVNVLEKLEQVDDGVTYPQESIMTKATDVSPEAAADYLETSKINRETRRTQAQINLLDKQAELAAKPAPPPKPTGKQVAKPEFEGAGQVSEKLSSKLEKYGIKLGVGALAATGTLSALLGRGCYGNSVRSWSQKCGCSCRTSSSTTDDSIRRKRSWCWVRCSRRPSRYPRRIDGAGKAA